MKIVMELYEVKDLTKNKIWKLINNFVSLYVFKKQKKIYNNQRELKYDNNSRYG